jgi:hypothetical protein
MLPHRCALDGLAADFFSVVVEGSLCFGFAGGFLRDLFLNALNERLSLTFFVRLRMVQCVFHCRFSVRPRIRRRGPRGYVCGVTLGPGWPNCLASMMHRSRIYSWCVLTTSLGSPLRTPRAVSESYTVQKLNSLCLGNPWRLTDAPRTDLAFAAWGAAKVNDAFNRHDDCQKHPRTINQTQS